MWGPQNNSSLSRPCTAVPVLGGILTVRKGPFGTVLWVGRGSEGLRRAVGAEIPSPVARLCRHRRRRRRRHLRRGVRIRPRHYGSCRPRHHGSCRLRHRGSCSGGGGVFAAATPLPWMRRCRCCRCCRIYPPPSIPVRPRHWCRRRRRRRRCVEYEAALCRRVRYAWHARGMTAAVAVTVRTVVG